MNRLQSGISLDIIRDFLGHVDAKTTQIYARANLEMKCKALEKISEPSSVQTIPSWQQNKGWLTWFRPWYPQKPRPIDIFDPTPANQPRVIMLRDSMPTGDTPPLRATDSQYFFSHQ